MNVRHALRQRPAADYHRLGDRVAGLLSGTLLVEVIFSWPGMGRLLVDSISARDYPMVQGLVILFALIYTLLNLIVDLLYPLVDPRIRYNDRDGAAQTCQPGVHPQSPTMAAALRRLLRNPATPSA